MTCTAHPLYYESGLDRGHQTVNFVGLIFVAPPRFPYDANPPENIFVPAPVTKMPAPTWVSVSAVVPNWKQKQAKN